MAATALNGCQAVRLGLARRLRVVQENGERRLQPLLGFEERVRAASDPQTKPSPPLEVAAIVARRSSHANNLRGRALALARDQMESVLDSAARKAAHDFGA